MLKKFTALTFAAIASTLLLTSCEDIETQIEKAAKGQKIFENYCADCHDLGEESGKFYLGVTFHLTDLEEYIQDEMPINEGDDCDAQCAEYVSAYIQVEMCEDEPDLTLCEDGQTGSESYENDDIGTKIALGALQFKYECVECHNITPDDTSDSVGDSVFIHDDSTPYFSRDGLTDYISQEMPKEDPTSCQDDCADNVTLYLQSQYCDENPEFAFCVDWDPALYTAP